MISMLKLRNACSNMLYPLILPLAGLPSTMIQLKISLGMDRYALLELPFLFMIRIPLIIDH